MSPFAIHAIEPGDEARIAEYVRVRSAVTPENPDSPEQARWEDATFPGEIARFLAELPGEGVVGAATTGRIWMHPPEYERYWLGLWVLPEARGHGLGSALLRAVGEVARSAGKAGFLTEVSEAQVEGCRFLASRGFVETGRSKFVRLDLAGVVPPAVSPPPGIRLTTLADEPGLLAGVHRVAGEAFPDVPTSDEPLHAGTLDEFTARDVDRVDVPRDAFFVAVHAGSGEVAGYASLVYRPGSRVVAFHDMTAVRRADRGRGIASALKRATVAWAIGHGLEALETGNDVENAPMRAVNAALGYTPLPDFLYLQGPLPPAQR